MKFCGECGTRLAVLCRECGARNAPAQKFCGECGARLESRGSSRQPPSPDAYTPKHLAEKILTSKTALEGERKQVTVLFADLKGSMELLADRDPEEAQKILNPVLERMMDAVHRFEGTVNQVMGDGIMALFGAPLAHEDHAARACYAALRMQEDVKKYGDEVRRSYGAVVRIRVGLNSGEVVVRAIGSDLHMDYTAVGQTTHLAARMEQLADPATVLLTPATLRLAEDFIQVHSLGPTPVKGLSEPIEVYALTGATAMRSRFQAHAARGLTKFVGRTSEMAQLAEALDLAQRGRGQFVAVVGEPGVGKSRLFWEFAHSHRTQGCLVMEAASVSYGKATTYFPVIELLRGYFQIELHDDTRKIQEKVTGKLLSLDRALEPALPAMLSRLDVPVEDEQWTRLDPLQRRQRTLESVKRLLLRESQVQPLVVIFEDLHWVDTETQVVLDSLIETLPTARLLLLVNYRPEYQHGWGSKTYYRQLRVDPLPARSAEDLLSSLLGADTKLEPLRRALIARTEGNPFFLEESVRALVETKVLAGETGAYRLASAAEQLQIPATAQAILAARIDRLEPEDKRLLQAASVIGKDVPLALLEAVGDVPEQELRRRLTRLQAAEFLYETRLFPELEYTFKHALTHEVTYGELLQARRCDLHARIVGAIERLHQDRLVEQIERLAYHALRGELWEKAVVYLRQAAQRAAARSALTDARLWFEQALGVIEVLPESQSTLELAFETRLELRPVLTYLGDVRQAVQRMREAETLAERLKDDHRQGRVRAFISVIYTHLGELDEAVAHGTRALDIARQLGDLRWRILSTSFLAQAHYLRADYERVVILNTANIGITPKAWLYGDFAFVIPPPIIDRGHLVMSLAQLGRFAEAAEYAAEGMQLAGRTGHAFSIGFSYFAPSTLHLLKGEWATARSLIERSIAVLRPGNVVLGLPVSLASSAWILAQLGEADEALSQILETKRLLEDHATRGIVGQSGWAYYLLGSACLLLGQIDEARSLGNHAVESSPHHPGFAGHARQLLGAIATHPDRFDAERGEAHYRHALALAESHGMRPLVAHCHLGLGKLHGRCRKREPALEHLTLATAMYREMGMAYWPGQAEAELRQLG
jgi:class 3 adenylate cyclase/tetratricopeptide (TPR) repeat protein